ncbi:MAG: hypothetical protein SGILL_010747, partial [Bacillariaceae sp.]
TEKSSMSSPSSSSQQSFAFGIEYDVVVGTYGGSRTLQSAKDWVPPEFLQLPSCSIATRDAFEVPGDGTTIVPLRETENEGQEKASIDASWPLPVEYPYQASIEQVLRRHHTNSGRFESWISTEPLLEADEDEKILPLECKLVYRQVLPSFLSPVWRSLAVDADFDEEEMESDPNDSIVTSVEWLPEENSSVLYVEARSNTGDEDDEAPTHLPSTFVISFEYEPSFLTLDDFPGDPNRGRELPPARLSIECTQGQQQSRPIPLPSVSVYSNTLMLLPPVPDMSMPFNVISLTSSLYAYIVGTLITILVRKGSEKIKYKLYPDKKPESKIQKIKKRIKEKFSRLRRR